MSGILSSWTMHCIQIPIYIDIEEMHDNKVSLSQCGHGDQSYLVWTFNTC